ncbi:MAG: nucleotidyltransferase domain-containing protein [Candidatus Korarchaeum sp.]
MIGLTGLRYYRMTDGERERLLSELRESLEGVDGILFAYVHGSFLERELFRDVDIALWIEDPKEAFSYEVELSSKLELRFKIPVDVQVLNGAPLPFIYIVLTKGRLLLSRDERIRVEVVDEVIREYADLLLISKISEDQLCYR